MSAPPANGPLVRLLPVTLRPLLPNAHSASHTMKRHFAPGTRSQAARQLLCGQSPVFAYTLSMM